MLKKWWSGIILNASHPSPKFSPFLDRPPDRGTALFARPSRGRPGNHSYCITQGYETQEFKRSETTGKSDSSESMTFRYIPDMINLAFFYKNSKDQRNATVFKYIYILKLYVSSIGAWTRLKYWKVIRFVGKLWCPYNVIWISKSFFRHLKFWLKISSTTKSVP